MTDEQQASLEAALAQRGEYLDQLQRALADFANYRRRIDRQLAQAGEEADGALLLDLLVVRDDLQRASEHASHHGQLVEGVRLTGERLDSLLARRGMEPVPDGGAFDPELHEALMTEPAENTEPGQVLRTLRTGWIARGRVVRHAQVVVSS